MSHDTLPFVGRSFEIRYGTAMTVRNSYAGDGRTMTYEVTEGEFAGATATVQYEAVALSPGLFALSWQEADRGVVVHLDDFAAGSSRSFYTTAGLDLFRMAGTLTRIEQPAP
jgi:hypothetical protein